MTEFVGFPKIPRYQRDIIITEKIDGTNAQVYIGEPDEHLYDGVRVLGYINRVKKDGFTYDVMAGSRKKWLTPGADNFGFAKWVYDHQEELVFGLGPGRHYGEWWGKGIQRGYGLEERRFSLFNTSKWGGDDKPKCCHVVPVLYRGSWDNADPDAYSSNAVRNIFWELQNFGSRAAPGFMKPEGIVIYHTAGNVGFKMTYEKDDTGKGDE